MNSFFDIHLNMNAMDPMQTYFACDPLHSYLDEWKELNLFL